MEERVSGFRAAGDWGAIVELGERITTALRETGAEGEALEEWEDWRPKADELLDLDVREKTAAHAAVEEGEGEQAGESPNDDIQTAGERLAESYESLEDADTERAVEKWQDSVNHVARAADSAGRKALRSVEGAVYKRVMTQLAPYYFDNELVSANVTRTRDEEAPFSLEVNINDDEFKQAVAERLEEFDDEVDRWHVAAEKETATAAAAEGAEPPKSESEPDAGDDPDFTRT
ncbi:MAG: DUF5828 family protein [Halobacteriales archaeon]